MPFRVVVVVNKSKVGISLCQPKSRQRIWQRPQSIEQASRVARLASRRVASHISSAAKTKRRAIGCPSLTPTPTPHPTANHAHSSAPFERQYARQICHFAKFQLRCESSPEGGRGNQCDPVREANDKSQLLDDEVNECD